VIVESEVEVAVKLINTKGLTKTIKREAELLWQLNGHPNCVHFYGIYEADDDIGLIFELIPDKLSLETLRNRKNDKDVDEISVIDQLVQALLYLHNKGIVHRDIKAANIMFKKHESSLILKLLDFGSARYSTLSKTVAATTLQGGGTFGYSPPEMFHVASGSSSPPQVLARRNVKADIWSFGIIVAELYLKKPPYAGQTAQQIAISMHSKLSPYN